ncbi:VOC family protein [Candidatus Microgenomates bacterium]|nr:MAG: VOC family protein [Candidatus Microgenomates bacterium]
MTKPVFKNLSTVLIWSGDFRKLANWYEEILELTPVKELNHPKDTGVLFEIGTGQLWIGQHAHVKGKNKDNCRFMFNLDVDSVNEAYEYLKSKGVKFLAKPFKAPTMEKYFATFYDPEDNLLQLFGKK